MEIREAFQRTRYSLNGDYLKTYELFEELFKLSRRDILMYPTQQMKEKEVDQLFSIIQDLHKGKPLAYCLKKAYFCEIPLYVDERVLIPRYDTERSVEVIENILPNNGKMLEIGTGSGCVSIAVGHLFPDAEIIACDISLDALAVAQINKNNHRIKNIKLIQSDLFGSVSGNYDLIYSNPPYIAKDEIQTLDKSVVEYEPRQALDGGIDGLNFYRAIISEAHTHLKKNAYLVFEIGAKQARDVENLLKENHFTSIRIKKDFNGLDRVIYGRLENV